MVTINVTPEDNLQQILDNISSPATICLSSGIYRQKIKISRPDVKIMGKDRETTIITFDDYARKIHADGKEFNTFRTYTVCVAAENVRLENLTVANSNTDPAAVGQCVALSVNAKRFSALNINLNSTQDTLFMAPFPDDLVVRYRGFIPQDELYMEGSSLHFFYNCRISGTVDFIFGCAEAYFYKCTLCSLNDGRTESYVTAPAHSLKQDRGFCFIDCDFVSGGAADGSVFLGRPWRDFGKCDFIDCKLSKHINPALFDKWNDTERDKTARFSYSKLECAAPVSPVPWCSQLGKEREEEIYRAMENARRSFNL